MKSYCTELKNVNGVEVPVQEKLNELYNSDSSRQDQIIKRRIGSQRYQRRILETTASNRAEKSIKTTTKFKLLFTLKLLVQVVFRKEYKKAKRQVLFLKRRRLI